MLAKKMKLTNSCSYRLTLQWIQMNFFPWDLLKQIITKQTNRTLPYFQQLNTLNMEGRVKSHALTLMHKIVKKISPKYLTDKLSYRQDIHNHNTRNRNTLNTRRLHTAKKTDAFS